MNKFQVEEDCVIVFADFQMYKQGAPDPKTAIWFELIRLSDGVRMGITDKQSVQHIDRTGMWIRFPIDGAPVPLEKNVDYEWRPMAPYTKVVIKDGGHVLLQSNDVGDETASRYFEPKVVE